MTALEMLALIAPVATLADRVPGFLFGLPLVALASLGACLADDVEPAPRR